MRSTHLMRSLAVFALAAIVMAIAIACGPARGGGGGSKDCETDEDCKRDEFCDIDRGEDEGKCRDLGGNNDANNIPTNNQPTNNQPTNNEPVNNEPVNNGPVNNGPVNNGPVNNEPVNNGPVNNEPVNNGEMLSEAECTLACRDTLDNCTDFGGDCDGAPEAYDRCAIACGDSAQRELVGNHLANAPGCNDSAAFFQELIAYFASEVCRPTDQFSCPGLCDHLFECTDPVCPGAIAENCVEICDGNPEDPQLRAWFDASCTELTDEFCVQDNETEAGAPCETAGECNAGSLEPVCIPPSSAWPDGYCSAQCRGDVECGSNNYCLPFADGNFCTAGCSGGDDSCRGPEYVCWPLIQDDSSRGICLPRCTSDADCGEGFFCNPDSGYCE